MATDLERMVVSLEANTKKFENALARATANSDRSFNRMSQSSARAGKQIEKNLTDSTARAAAAMGNAGAGLFTRSLAAVGAALGTREIIQYADSWTRATNALKVAGLSGADLGTVMGQLFDAAQRQGAPIEALTTLYGRAAQSAKELGATQQDLVQFSEDVAVALRVAGTSPSEATGALLQLSQLLGSSRVQAEEFNSVNEGARPILQAVANGIEEAGGSVSKLKALVADGKISNVAFFKGFQAGAEGLREQAGAATETIAQGFTRVSNAATKAVGELDKTSGASANAVQNMKGVATAIEAIPTAVDAAVTKLGMLQQWLTNVGNSSFWNKIGPLLGVDFSAAEAARNGLSPAPRDQGIAALKGGQGTALGAGFDVSDLASSGKKPAAKTIKAADYPVIGGKEKKGAAEKVSDFDREVAAVSKHTEALRLEAEMVGKGTYETAKARAALSLFTAARQEGIEITPAIREQIEQEADAYGRASVEFERLTEKQQQLNQLQQEFGNIAGGSISGLIDGTQTFADALTNATKRMSDLVLQAALLGDGPLGGLFGSAASGGKAGGIIGLLSGALGGAGGTVGATAGATFGFAGGGLVRGPGTGRSDDIPARLSNGEYVVNARDARRNRGLLDRINSGQVQRMADGGSVGRIITANTAIAPRPVAGVTFAPSTTIDARGSTMSREEMASILAQSQRETLRQVPGLVERARGRQISSNRT
ncbi:tape measure protein [Xanthobacter sp. DSM 24535]|uniref:tape measure protein n=1 Tax=Roseixanthobacter psychrophilus TaxID=3119917 RepID=UPI003726CA95